MSVGSTPKARLVFSATSLDEIEARLGYKLSDDQAVGNPDTCLDVIMRHIINLNTSGEAAFEAIEEAVAEGTPIEIYVIPRVSLSFHIVQVLLSLKTERLVATLHPTGRSA
jgi:hypothetical protein